MPAPLHAVNIRDYLVGIGITPVTVGFLTASPINQSAVIEFSGPMNITVHSSTAPIALDEGNVQVMVRHSSAATALTSVMAVVDALDELGATGDVTINAVVYTRVAMIGRPRILDRQDDGAVIMIAEFSVESRR